MKLIAQDKHFAVLDNVFEQSAFEGFWEYFNSLDFAYRSMIGWQKVWRITDGQVLAGPPSYHSQAPFNSKMDLLHQTVVALAEQHLQGIVGKQGEDWQDLFFTPYIYPVGTKISWHDDFGYAGACIFYPHLEWSPNWGGELLIAKTPGATEIESDIPQDLLTRKHLDPLINHYGMGVYVSPNPNRIVFTSEKVWHSINRVDQSAGDHVRCSVVGFFTKDKLN